MAQEPLPPPRIPESYHALSSSAPLLSLNDEQWVCRVYAEAYQEAGLLIFTDGQEVAFLTSKEAVTLLGMQLSWATTLLAECGATYRGKHAVSLQGIRLAARAYGIALEEKQERMTLQESPRYQQMTTEEVLAAWQQFAQSIEHFCQQMSEAGTHFLGWRTTKGDICHGTLDEVERGQHIIQATLTLLEQVVDWPMDASSGLSLIELLAVSDERAEDVGFSLALYAEEGATISEASLQRRKALREQLSRLIDSLQEISCAMYEILPATRGISTAINDATISDKSLPKETEQQC